MVSTYVPPAMTLTQVLSVFTLPDTIGDIVVRGFSIDSRAIGQGDIFVAMAGVHVHGEKYIPQAVDQGASAIFVNADNGLSVRYENNTPIIALPSLGKILSHIVGQFYGHPTQSLPVIGITGTNGKTTCSQLYAQISALDGKLSGVIGTNGYGLCRVRKTADGMCSAHTELTSTGMTTPEAITVQSICASLSAAGSENIVMEVSSHGLEQDRVAAIDFDGAIFTNLSHDHLDYHGTMAAYGEAKSKLFMSPSLSFAIINLDDAFAKALLAKIHHDVRVITYSTQDSSADLYLSNITYQASSTQAELHSPIGSYTLSTRLVGLFNLSNLLAVLGAFYAEKCIQNNVAAFEKIISLIEFVQPITGRMEAINNTVNRQVIIDYAHTPDALKNVLQAVNEYATGKVYCVFGCGGDRDQDKRQVMASIAERYADHVVVTDDNPRNEDPQQIIDHICAGFLTSKYQVIRDRERAIHAAIHTSSAGDIIVVAGKGHEDYQLIGETKIPFSDQAVARLTLRDMEAASL
jgi:UDP-N-acetylmuramoyl-L-alanyl-D-glutamate--2,6-diaminopimelate ligase